MKTKTTAKDAEYEEETTVLKVALWINTNSKLNHLNVTSTNPNIHITWGYLT